MTDEAKPGPKPPTDASTITMNPRELALYQAGEASGIARGLETSAAAIDMVAARVKSGLPVFGSFVAWATALSAKIAASSRPIAAGRPAKAKFDGVLADVTEASYRTPKIAEEFIGLLHETSKNMRAQVLEQRSVFVNRASAAAAFKPKAPTLTQRIAKRALEKLAGDD